MNHLQLKSRQYKRMLEERRGHNYEYWTEKQWRQTSVGIKRLK
jgi:hypothetical protein